MATPVLTIPIQSSLSMCILRASQTRSFYLLCKWNTNISGFVKAEVVSAK